MINSLVKKSPKRKVAFMLTAILTLAACADNQIQHCVYGVSDNVQKIEAKLCNDDIIPYVVNGDFWESKDVISNPCETVIVQFTYKDGRTGEYEGLYLSGGGYEITDHGKFRTDDPATIHLMKAARNDKITKCPVEQDIKFLRDYTSGELCDSRYYECSTK